MQSPVVQAVAYLRSNGEPVRAVDTERLRRLGWRWYAPTSMQLLTDEDVVTYAHNHREMSHA
jgi:hypothetical protein